MAAYSPVSSRSTRNLHTIRRRDSLSSSIGATSVRRLIAVVRNTSGRTGPVYSKKILIKNLVMLCISHLLVSSSFLPFLALQGSVSVWSRATENDAVRISVNVGSLLLMVLYFMASLSSLLSPSLVQKLGTNSIFLISYSVFCVFYIAHMFPFIYLLFPLYIVAGFVLGPISLARVSFLMVISSKLSYVLSDEDQDAKFLRRTCVVRRVARAFKAAHDIGLILGSLFSALLITYTISLDNLTHGSFLNSSTSVLANCTATTLTPASTETETEDYSSFLDEIFDKDESNERLCGFQACPSHYLLPANATEEEYFHILPNLTTKMLAGAYSCTAALALLVAALGFNRIRMLVYQDPLERPEGLAALRAVKDSFKDMKLRLAAPLAVFIGLEQAFMYADFSKVRHWMGICVGKFFDWSFWVLVVCGLHLGDP